MDVQYTSFCIEVMPQHNLGRLEKAASAPFPVHKVLCTHPVLPEVEICSGKSPSKFN